MECFFRGGVITLTFKIPLGRGLEIKYELCILSIFFHPLNLIVVFWQVLQFFKNTIRHNIVGCLTVASFYVGIVDLKFFSVLPLFTSCVFLELYIKREPFISLSR